MRSTLLKMTRRGFTLIELMVVVAIIALLVAAGLPQYTGAQKKARNAKISADMKAIQSAQEVYYSVNSEYAINFDNLAWGTAKPLPPALNKAKSGSTLASSYEELCTTLTTVAYTCVALLEDSGSITIKNLQ